MWTISVEKTGGYVVSKLVLAALSAVFHVAFFWFIDVPFWLPLGIFAGIVGQFIPTIGTYIGVALPALFALLDKPINALWIAVFATVYQQLENYVFTPRISRRTMDVHPAVALGSVIAGAALFGPIGALIGIPIAAVALAIVDTFSKRHELRPRARAASSRTTTATATRKGTATATARTTRRTALPGTTPRTTPTSRGDVAPVEPAGTRARPFGAGRSVAEVDDREGLGLDDLRELGGHGGRDRGVDAERDEGSAPPGARPACRRC